MRITNNISRRDLLKRLAFLCSAPLLLSGCRPSKKIKGKIVEDNAVAGHLLRDGIPPSPSETKRISTLIVGGGVSGLSAGYHLNKGGVTDFLLLELGNESGGNSIAGKNALTAYPWAAHYLPLANNSNKELIQFLRDHEIITGFDAGGLPVYNDYYLCFDPEERLFIKGHWQDGLIPQFGLEEQEKKQIAAFFALVAEYRNRVGTDGKSAFEIPLAHSSHDPEFLKLDGISFYDFVRSKGFDSEHLLWYLEYCCKDDYGSSLKETSAYAGLHYFCARRAKASNAESSAVLTWPEGNAFLASKLSSPIRHHILCNRLVTSVRIEQQLAEVICFDTTTKHCTKYICDQVIMATPQYINARLIPETLRPAESTRALFEYHPWVVANISLSDLPEHKGEPLSWDNVIVDSPSLGYVNACHQQLKQHHKALVITYYLPLVYGKAKDLRAELRNNDFETLSSRIVKDLEKVHPDIQNFITRMDIKLWGHGMIKPKPGFLFHPDKQAYATNIQNTIFFAHSDLSGISIFEEAFYQGSEAAKQLLSKYAGRS